jgi:hypothetical protein
MKMILAAAAALALMSAGAMAAAPGVSCDTSAVNNQGKSDTNATQAPAASTCETLVMPSGKTSVQNGPGTTNNGSNTHEGSQ